MDEVNEEKEQTDDEIQVVKTPVVKKKIYNMKFQNLIKKH